METTTAPAQLKISGELTHDPDVCKFHLSRPLTDGWTLIFNTTADGKGSPLIDALFAIEGIAHVMADGSTLTIAKNVPAGWPQLASDVAKAIRATCSGDAPPISPNVIAELESAPMDGVEEIITKLFEDHINPGLASHGGFVKLSKVDGHDVYVEMGGGCQGCSSAKATMRHGVETAIRRVAPQIRKIVDATDHAAGENPFFK